MVICNINYNVITFSNSYYPNIDYFKTQMKYCYAISTFQNTTNVFGVKKNWKKKSKTKRPYKNEAGIGLCILEEDLCDFVFYTQCTKDIV